MIDERNVLTSEIAFVATALFNIMRTAISIMPMTVQVLLQDTNFAVSPVAAQGQPELCLLKTVGTSPGYTLKRNVQGG
ncbi:hypothetical protein J6590_017165 [Homalodisca vitripennis]|nr:hypothetical protein J6590_017165 [Homalodisca vitripennis]